ncbi:MAG: hypothetical protein ACI9MR_002401 [Myxococcota bacterium]
MERRHRNQAGTPQRFRDLGLATSAHWLVLLGVLFISGCDSSDSNTPSGYATAADSAQTDSNSDASPGGTTVTYVVYVDDQCTVAPPANSVVQLDRTVDCNETPDSSISNIVCLADKVTYTNHPNTPDCSAEGIENEIPVGVCTQFPGPVPTWKYIDPATYDCHMSGRPRTTRQYPTSHLSADALVTASSRESLMRPIGEWTAPWAACS